jgi:hypothetical protein
LKKEILSELLHSEKESKFKNPSNLFNIFDMVFNYEKDYDDKNSIMIDSKYLKRQDDFIALITDYLCEKTTLKYTVDTLYVWNQQAN